VDAHHSGSGKQAVQRGDVAETYQPFGMGSPFSQRKLVYQLNGAIAAAVADDGFDGCVV
jgi:hypothetical protein